MIVDLNALYSEMKYWLPFVTFFTLVLKAWFTSKTKIAAWASSLLDNHLHSIQTAVESTQEETKQTNSLLLAQAAEAKEGAKLLAAVADNLKIHNEKELEVWNGVTTTLSILSDRTQRTSRRKK